MRDSTGSAKHFSSFWYLCSSLCLDQEPLWHSLDSFLMLFAFTPLFEVGRRPNSAPGKRHFWHSLLFALQRGQLSLPASSPALWHFSSAKDPRVLRRIKAPWHRNWNQWSCLVLRQLTEYCQLRTATDHQVFFSLWPFPHVAIYDSC